MLGRLKTIVQDPIQGKLLILFIVFIGAIGTIITVETHFRSNSRNDQRRLNNQVSHLTLWEHVIHRLLHLQFAIDELTYVEQKKEIHTKAASALAAINEIRQVLNTLEKGGTYIDRLKKNDDTRTPVFVTITYYPDKSLAKSKDPPKVRTHINAIRAELTRYIQLCKNEKEDVQSLSSKANDRIDSYRRITDFITSTEQIAHYAKILANQTIRTITETNDRRTRILSIHRLALFSVIIIILLISAIIITRQIGRSIEARKHAESQLGQLNEQLEEIISRRTRDLGLANIGLAESEAHLRQIVDLVPHLIFVKDRDGNILLANEAYAANWNSTPQEITQQNISKFLNDPTERRMVIHSDQTVIDENKEWKDDRWPMTSADGTIRWLDMVKVPISFFGKPAALGVGIDVTDKIQEAEEKLRLEQQLRQTQKMEAIGRLAGGIAHDVNNVLGSIMSLTTVLQMELDNNSRFHRDLKDIMVACERGKDLTRDLLGFARKGKYVKGRINLTELAQSTVSLLSRTISKKIRINTNFDQNIKNLEGDVNQIEHALMNVCINAVDAMQDFGTLTISTYTSSDSKTVSLKVTDTGIGISPHFIDKIFEPFFTTKPKGQGTGLGLSMVYGTVKNHGGTIDVDSKQGIGTSFTFTFPVTPTHAPPPVIEDEEVTLTSSLDTECLLLIDDEDMVLRSTHRLLEKMGFRVLLANSGKKGIRLYMENQTDISLVLLDFIMPEMDGAETFNELRKINPKVKTIIVSGYSKDHKVNHVLENGALGFIQKPFNISMLSEAIAKAMEGHSI